MDVLEFVRAHGVVLASAKGPVPNVADAIAGEAIRGSWWAHPDGKRIFAALRTLEESDEVLCCQAVAGKRTFVHARLWPALVRCAARFPAARLAWTREVHLPSGKHARRDIAFPAWVPDAVAREASALAEADALAALGDWAR
jgi:hypothetical protein